MVPDFSGELASKQSIPGIGSGTGGAPLLVQKFGGTSVASVEHIRRVAERALSARKKGLRVVVVVSAMSGETNRLLRLAAEAAGGAAHLDSREADVVAATGEQVVAALTALAIRAAGGRARSFLSHQVRILTDSMHSDARVRDIERARLLASLADGEIPVVAGFQGVDASGAVTTLGRGGSDTTAVALAAALGADHCEIFTDVDGVYSADPNVCPGARKLPRVSYGHMLALAGLGGKVLHGRSVALAMRHNVKVQVRSSFSENEGTWVAGDSPLELTRVNSVAMDPNVARLRLRWVPRGEDDISSRLIEQLGATRIQVDMFHHSLRGGERPEMELSFVIRRSDLPRALELLGGCAMVPPESAVESDDAVAKVSLVGPGLGANPAPLAEAMRLLRLARLPVQAVATGDLFLSFLLAREHAEQAMRVLHEGFDLGVNGSSPERKTDE